MKKTILNVLIAATLLASGCSRVNKQQVEKFVGTFSEYRWAIHDLNPALPPDWSSFRYLTLDINSSTTHRFELSLYDTGGVRRLEILPFQNVWIRASIPLVHFQKMNTEGMDQASIWKRPRTGCWIGFTGVVGPIRHIDSLWISMHLPVDTPTIEIRNIRLTMMPEDSVLTPNPVVDGFGQWIPDEWPGKAKSVEDLKASWSEEEQTLKSGNPLMTKYGGFSGTKARATGFFHVEKIGNIWWFVDPEGCLFYSNGSCCIDPGTDLARLEGRRYLFSDLPPDAGHHSHGFSGIKKDISSFYTWNLSRRFGSDWYQKWIDLTFLRMASWGINTIGNWSDHNLGLNHKMAYVATLEGWGIENGKMGMPDVYTPGYNASVDSAAAKQCSPLKDDPWLLGYFIGNELPWPGRETELADVILSGEDSPMKAALTKYLSTGDSPERRREFAYETYSRFFSIVCSSIKKYDPNHLNLGLRFGDPPSPEIITASKKFFNVFSINHYGYYVSHDVIQHIYELTDLPVIIGEFHFGIPGRGLAPGLAQTPNPEERAAAYRYYVENAAAHPAVIGTHWFQWIDQPSTGRFDGENYNIGLVDVTDRPYPEMIKATGETFNRLLNVHSGKEPPVDREALVQ